MGQNNQGSCCQLSAAFVGYVMFNQQRLASSDIQAFLGSLLVGQCRQSQHVLSRCSSSTSTSPTGCSALGCKALTVLNQMNDVVFCHSMLSEMFRGVCAVGPFWTASKVPTAVFGPASCRSTTCMSSVSSLQLVASARNPEA